jgi:fido (protein-threonine AMPylation protein)
MEKVKNDYIQLLPVDSPYFIYDHVVRCFTEGKFFDRDINIQFKDMLYLVKKYSTVDIFHICLGEMYAMYGRFDLAYSEMLCVKSRNVVSDKIQLFLELNNQYKNDDISWYDNMALSGKYIIPEPIYSTPEYLPGDNKTALTQDTEIRAICIDTNEIEQVISMDSSTKSIMIHLGIYASLNRKIDNNTVNILRRTLDAYEKKYNWNINIDIIKQIHFDVMVDSYIFGNKYTSPGQWRNITVYCEYPKSTLFCRHDRIDEYMNSFIDQYHNIQNTANPWILSAWLHYNFIIIHPFLDGNGRVARIISSFPLLKEGYGWINVLNSRKKEYYDALHEVTVLRSLKPLADVFYRHTIETRRQIKDLPYPTEKEIEEFNISNPTRF